MQRLTISLGNHWLRNLFLLIDSNPSVLDYFKMLPNDMVTYFLTWHFQTLRVFLQAFKENPTGMWESKPLQWATFCSVVTTPKLLCPVKTLR